MRPNLDPRGIALEVLTQVHGDGAYANLVLPTLLGDSGLAERDKALATELAYGVLRREGEIDIVLSSATSRAVADIDAVARDILRLGIYQILWLRIPDHAAVDQSVRMAKRRGLHKAVGFINGVLRGVVTKGAEYWRDAISKDLGCVEAHPRWIADALHEALVACDGADELVEALQAHNESPQVALACLPGLSAPTALDQRTPLSEIGVLVPRGDPNLDPRLSGGAARVQDEGSQLAALILSRYRPLTEGERLLDMCAGPGGKTAVLAAEAGVVGATVVAVEKIPHRARLVADSTRAPRERYPGVLDIRVGDATEVDETAEKYDRILLDAPCSGLGALRRRPEARWRKSPDDIPELNDLQKKLLEAGLAQLKPGGVLAYVTCSPVTSETTAIVSAVVGDRPDWERVDTPEVLERISRSPIQGHRRGSAVQLWTHRHGTDAMFVQLITRKELDRL